MNWRTHAILGANAVWVSAAAGVVDRTTATLAIAGALAGLLPDIDATSAKVHYIGGGTLGMFRGAFRHRAFFHSFLAVVLLFIASTLALSGVHPLLPLVITLGYASHPLIDAFNKPGVQLLWPLKYRIRFVPKTMSPKVDGNIDQGIFVLGTLLLALFLVGVYYPYIQTQLSTSVFAY